MSSPQYNLASLLTACAIALAAAGCHAPWSMGNAFQRPQSPSATTTASAKNPPPRVTRTPPVDPAPLETATAPDAATGADMAGVLDKLQQVGQLDPAAQRKLMDQLRQTDPKFWPATAEQFRASLAYHQELVAKERLVKHDSDAPPHPRRAKPAPAEGLAAELLPSSNRKTTESRPVPAPPYTVSASPSTPLGSLVDPRGADADGVSSEALAHTAPSSQKPPLITPESNSSQTAAAANFEPARTPIPIAAERRTPATKRPTSSAVFPASFNAPGQSPAGADAETEDEKDWQQLVVAAADDLSQRVADSPATTAEVHQYVSLRILRLLAGQTEAALEPIPHIAPAEQDYWSRQLFAMATYLDHHSQPDEKRRAAASVVQLDEAVSSLRELGALSLRNFAFCKNIYGYGAIEPYSEDRFSPSQQVSLYVEVENYHSQSTEKGFTTSLSSTYEILDEKGERVDGGQFPNVDDCCRGRRRDFHIQFGLKLPPKIEPGRYQLELVVRDRQSDKIAHATAPFEIRGSVVSPPPKPTPQ